MRILLACDFYRLCLIIDDLFRYNWSKTKFEYGQVRRGMQEHAMYEGTQLEQKVQEESQSV